MALVGSLWEELAVLHQDVDLQAHSMAYTEGKEGEDKYEHPAIKRHLHSFRHFVSDMLPYYTPQLNPSL